MLIHCTDTADPVCFYGRIGDVAETVSQKDFLQIHYSLLLTRIFLSWIPEESTDSRDCIGGTEEAPG